MPRLPVYIIIDTSESMAGAPIKEVNQALADFRVALNSYPAKMEIAYVSIITFNEKAVQLFELTNVQLFQNPQLTADSSESSNYGEALSTLWECLNKEVVFRTTVTQRADYRPLVFF